MRGRPPHSSAARRTEAERRAIPYLGEIPLDMQIRQTSDDGRPIVAIEPDGVHARHYIGMAREIWTTIVTGAAHRPPPRIVIE
jgi:ATP-binding protein involved in chromosome partitioning